MGQSALFDLYLDNKFIGKMTVAKTIYFNNKFSIDVNTYFQIEAMGVSTIKLYASSFFKKNILSDTESILERNGKIKEQCTVRLENTTYIITRKNEKPIKLENTSINTTLNTLFLSEPNGFTKVFSERFGNFCDITSVGQGIYEVVPPMGGTIRFYYKNGICIQVETTGNLQNITYKLVSK